MSSRHLQDMPSRHVFKTSSRRLQRINFSFSKTSWRRLGRRKIVMLKTCWRRLQDQYMFAGIYPHFYNWLFFPELNLYKAQSSTITEINKYKKNHYKQIKKTYKEIIIKKILLRPTQCTFHNVLLSYWKNVPCNASLFFVCFSFIDRNNAYLLSFFFTFIKLTIRISISSVRFSLDI